MGIPLIGVFGRNEPRITRPQHRRLTVDSISYSLSGWWGILMQLFCGRSLLCSRSEMSRKKPKQIGERGTTASQKEKGRKERKKERKKVGKKKRPNEIKKERKRK